MKCCNLYSTDKVLVCYKTSGTVFLELTTEEEEEEGRRSAESGDKKKQNQKKNTESIPIEWWETLWLRCSGVDCGDSMIVVLKIAAKQWNCNSIIINTIFIVNILITIALTGRIRTDWLIDCASPHGPHRSGVSWMNNMNIQPTHEHHIPA